MPLADKVASAKKVESFLRATIVKGGFKLKYRITVDPPLPEERDWEKPDILVELSGPDSDLLLERGGELLRAMEHLALEMLRLGREEHDRVSFDCRGFRAMRIQELRLAADVAAERVRKTGTPYEFGPMTSRERRIVHLALRDHADLRTESAGEAAGRHVVLYPKDYKPRPAAAPRFGRRR
jgi:spoIIIJ-associated protein